jgi:hypothetical protein
MSIVETPPDSEQELLAHMARERPQGCGDISILLALGPR